jgi:hypothetical protein
MIVMAKRSAFVHIKINQQMMERLMPVTWNHRVLLIEAHGEKSYCIHEVHYDDDGSILGWTENAEQAAAKRRHHPQPHRGRAPDADLAMTTESPGS